MPRGSVGLVPAAAPRRSARGPSQLREDQRRQVARLDALGRTAAGAPLLVLGLGRADPLALFLAVVLVRSALAATELARAGRRDRRLPAAWAVHGLDAVLLAGALALTDGASSPLLAVLIVAPVAMGAAGALDGAAWLAGTALAAYAAAVVVDLLDAGGTASVDAEDVVLAATAIVGTGVAGVLLGRIAQPLVLRAARTRSGTSRLLNAGLDLADRERRRVSQSLHEGPLQDLLAARQEVQEGDPAALQRANRAVGLAHDSTVTAADALDPRPGSAISLQERLHAALERHTRGTVRVSAGSRVDESDEQLLLELALGLGDVVERHAPEDALITARVDAEGRQVKLWVDSPGDLGALRRWTSRLSADAAALGCSVLLGAGGPGRTTVQVRLAPPAEREERARAVVGRRTTVQTAIARTASVLAATAGALLFGARGLPGFAVGGALVLAECGLLAVALGRDWRRYPGTRAGGVDVVGIVALVATTGGATSPLALLLPLGPFVLLWAVGGRRALGLLASLVGAYLVGSLSAAVLGSADLDPATLARTAVVAAWVGLLVHAVEGVRRRLAEQAEQAEAERRAVLSASLAGAGAERSRLAGVLRDGALRWLERAEGALRAAVVATGSGRREPIEDAGTAIGHATAALRAVSDELHPPALEHSGLAVALRTGIGPLAAEAGLRARVDIDDDVGGPHDELLIALVRELVLNAGRHARAEEVVVRLRAGQDGLHLEVADDGRGLPADPLDPATSSGRHGLALARERAEAVGGWLRLGSTPGVGTTVAVHLPALRPLPPAPGELSRVG